MAPTEYPPPTIRVQAPSDKDQVTPSAPEKQDPLDSQSNDSSDDLRDARAPLDTSDDEFDVDDETPPTPSSDLSEVEDPGLILRQNAVPNNGADGFWPEKLLDRLLSTETFQELIRRLGIEALCGGERPSTALANDGFQAATTDESQNKSYRKMLTLLVLLSKETYIDRIIREGISDDCLPLILLRAKSGEPKLFRRGHRMACLSCLDHTTREGFSQRQWQLLVPFFKLDANSKAEHHTLPRGTILPWDVKEKRKSVDHIVHGGYAFVQTVSIHEDSHDFGPVLEMMKLVERDRYAIKCLNPSTADKAKFNNEKEQLNRFSALATNNKHLVTLLASYTLEGKYFFLFPYAKCDLLFYWEELHPKNTWTIENVHWVSAQMAGLMSGLSTIHNPSHEHIGPKDDWRYGRHGDIKPDNILWFPTTDDPQGILVISDMGLSSINRLQSRSDIPGNKVAGVPGYCPPECGPEGKVSRKFDIWTMGCLYLDFLTWLLKEKEGYGKFLKARETPMEANTSVSTNGFFKRLDGPYFTIKPEVVKWIESLHGDSSCSEFVHEVLDIIQDKMLVAAPKRAESSELLKMFNNIDKKRSELEGSPEYFFSGKPRREIPVR